MKIIEFKVNMIRINIEDEDFFVGIVQVVAGIEPTPFEITRVQTPWKSGKVISVSCDACGCVCCFLDLICKNKYMCLYVYTTLLNN